MKNTILSIENVFFIFNDWTICIHDNEILPLPEIDQKIHLLSESKEIIGDAMVMSILPSSPHRMTKCLSIALENNALSAVVATTKYICF